MRPVSSRSAFLGLLLSALAWGGSAAHAQDPAPPPQPAEFGARSCVFATLRERSQCAFLSDLRGVESLGNERIQECQTECVRCCDAYDSGWTEQVYQALCNCLSEMGATPSGLISCMDPVFLAELAGTSADPADLDGLREALLALTDAFQGLEGGLEEAQQLLDSGSWIAYLPPGQQADLQAGQVLRALNWNHLARQLLQSATETCSQLGGDPEDTREICRNECRRVFPQQPSEPEQPEEPEEPGDGDGHHLPGHPGEDAPAGGDNPLGDPCLGFSGQSCTDFVDGVLTWQVIGDDCRCGTGRLNDGCGEDEFADACWLGGGNGDILFGLIYQLY